MFLLLWKKEDAYDNMIHLKDLALEESEPELTVIIEDLASSMSELELSILKDEEEKILINLDKTLIDFIRLVIYEFGEYYFIDFIKANKDELLYRKKDMKHIQRSILTPFFTLRKNMAYYMIDHSNGLRTDSLFALVKYSNYLKSIKP